MASEVKELDTQKEVKKVLLVVMASQGDPGSLGQKEHLEIMEKMDYKEFKENQVIPTMACEVSAVKWATKVHQV